MSASSASGLGGSTTTSRSWVVLGNPCAFACERACDHEGDTRRVEAADKSVEQALELCPHVPRAVASSKRAASWAPQSLRKTTSRASAAVSSGWRRRSPSNEMRRASSLISTARWTLPAAPSWRSAFNWASRA